MRGDKQKIQVMFSYKSIEERIAADHPIRRIKEIVDEVLEQLSSDFGKLYSKVGRPGIAPERLLKALLLQVLFSVRSERQLVEQIEYNLMYKWFLDMNPDDESWNATTFTKNRDRLLQGEIADKFFKMVIWQAEKKQLVSPDHFTVDGTLIEAWASLKSITPKKKSKNKRDDDDNKGNPSVDFRGERRKNDTHESTTDSEARIYTKSKGAAAKLSYMGHVAMENRNGLAMAADVTTASYHAEHEAAVTMMEEIGGENRKTLGADKHYDNNAFCEKLRKMNITPHVAQNIHARKHSSAVDGRATRHAGYVVSLRKRKLVEEIFGWLKTVGQMRRPMFRGKQKIGFAFKFAVSVYNILRISNLTAQIA